MAKTKKQKDETPVEVSEKTDELGEGFTKLEADSEGNGFLPGTEPIVVEELISQAKAFKQLSTEHMKNAAKLGEMKKELMATSLKHLPHFRQNENNPDEMIYSAGGYTVVYTHATSEKISVEAASSSKKKSDE